MLRKLNSMKRQILSGLILLAGILSCTGQTPYLVTHYSKMDYDGGNQNWSIDTDKQGFIYIGNNRGLLIFDGVHWKLYQIPGQTIIRSVSVSDENRIYTGSYEDFGYWQKDTESGMQYHSLKTLLENFSFHNDEIWKIIQCNGKVYFQSFSALFVYDQHTVKSIPIPGTIIFLLKVNDRLFVQSVQGDLFELIGESLQLRDTKNVLQGTEVKAILPYSNGSLLIGTSSKGLFLYDGTTMKPWNVPANEQFKKYQINNGIIAGNRLVFGTIVKGLFILDFNGNTIFHLHNENALQNNTILSLCAGRDGGIWAGLDKGIDNISFNSTLDIYKEPGEQLGAVYSASSSGNTLYIGTNRGIFTYRKDRPNDRFRYSGFLNQSQGQVWELKTIDGTLFCGHTNGTYVIRDGRLNKISNISGGYDIEKYTREGQEFLIQSTYSTLVVYKKIKNQWVYLHQVSGFVEPSRFLEIDHLNNIWLGHAVKGAYRLRLSENMDSVVSKTFFGKKDGFPSDFNIHTFKIEDRIVFTTGSQLYTYDDLNNKIIPYTLLNNQLNGFENATNIVRLGENRYCLIRSNDMALFEIKENKASQLFRFFLPLYKVNTVDGYENVVKIDAANNLVCLDDGFALFPGQWPIPIKKDSSKIIFLEVSCFNTQGEKKSVKVRDNFFTLKHAWNTLQIDFTYTNQRIPSKRFQFKLEPLDRDWGEWSEKAEVKYSRLPKGQYIFMVRTITETGAITPPAAIHFSVKPAMMVSAAAFIVYFFLLAAVILISLAIFKRRFIRKQEKIRQEAETKLLFEKQIAEQEVVKLHNENLQSEISHKNIQLANSTMAILKKNELLIEIKSELEKLKKQQGYQVPAGYNQRILSLINNNISNDNDWKIFEELFDQAHANFFKRLKSSYPELTQSDLKLSAYLRLNLTSKEIAPLLNISYRGIETRRYRLRKRLLLDSDENLVEFILQF